MKFFKRTRVCFYLCFCFYFRFCFCFYFLLLILLLTIPCHKALTNLSSQPSHFHVRCWFLFLYFIFDCLRTQCLYLVQVWFAFFNGFYAITTLLVIKITTTSLIKLLDISNLILNMNNESIRFSSKVEYCLFFCLYHHPPKHSDKEKTDQQTLLMSLRGFLSATTNRAKKMKENFFLLVNM